MKKKAFYIGVVVVVLGLASYFGWQYYQLNFGLSSSEAATRLTLVCGDTSCPGSPTSNNPNIKTAISCIDNRWSGNFAELVGDIDSLPPHAGGSCKADGSRACAVYALDVKIEYKAVSQVTRAANACKMVTYLIDKNGNATRSPSFFFGSFSVSKEYDHLHFELKNSTSSCGCKWVVTTPSPSPKLTPTPSSSVNPTPSPAFSELPLTDIYPSAESVLKHPIVLGEEKQEITFTVAGGAKDYFYKSDKKEYIPSYNYKWSISSGSLPTGLRMEGYNNQLVIKPSFSGTPAPGTYSFTLKVEDKNGNFKTKPYTIKVEYPKGFYGVVASAVDAGVPTGFVDWNNLRAAVLNITNRVILSPAVIGKDFVATFNTPGLSSPISWSISSGSLPLGLALSNNNIYGKEQIKGKPSAGQEEGLYNFTVKVKDANGRTVLKDLSIRLYTKQPFTIKGGGISTTPPGSVLVDIGGNYYMLAGAIGRPYESYNTPAGHEPVGQYIQAYGGSGSYTWSIVSGSLPLGVVIQESGCGAASSDGPNVYCLKFSGTPTTKGIYKFQVEIKDSNGSSAKTDAILSVDYTIPFDGSNVIGNSSNTDEVSDVMFNNTAGTLFLWSFRNYLSGQNLTYSLSGNVPPHMSYAAVGARFQGFPLVGESGKIYNFVLTSRDSDGHSVSRRVSMFNNQRPSSITQASAGTIFSSSNLLTIYSVGQVFSKSRGERFTVIPDGFESSGTPSSYRLLAGSLPAGITFDATGTTKLCLGDIPNINCHTANLLGTLTGASVGSYDFIVKGADPSGEESVIEVMLKVK